MFVDFFKTFCILLSPCTFLSNFDFYILTQSIMPRSRLMFPWQNFIMKTFLRLTGTVKIKRKYQYFEMRYFDIFQSHSANNADIFQGILRFASKPECPTHHLLIYLPNYISKKTFFITFIQLWGSLKSIFNLLTSKCTSLTSERIFLSMW